MIPNFPQNIIFQYVQRWENRYRPFTQHRGKKTTSSWFQDIQSTPGGKDWSHASENHKKMANGSRAMKSESIAEDIPGDGFHHVSASENLCLE